MIFNVAKNIDEYLEIIKQIKSENPLAWYRGQSNSHYQLEPSLYREKGMITGNNKEAVFMRATNGKYILQDDITALYKFKKYYDTIHVTDKFQFIDYLYIMQHYGIPTRLLDFTENELVALYFSVSSRNSGKIKDVNQEIEDFYEYDSYTDSGSAVFCIDPVKTNNESFMKKQIIDLKEYSFESLGYIDTPVCIKTQNPDKRIIAQKGAFMFFGFYVNPYDYYTVFNNSIYKIFIPNSCRKQILSELKTKFSISHSTMYPDIEGIVMEIKQEIKDKFVNDCAKWQE